MAIEICRIDRGRASVWSRNGKDWTEKFQKVIGIALLRLVFLLHEVLRNYRAILG